MRLREEVVPPMHEVLGGQPRTDASPEIYGPSAAATIFEDGRYGVPRGGDVVEA